jgi:hypothetical protein
MSFIGTLTEELPGSKCNLPLLCSYVNQTSSVQIIRIQDRSEFYLERVVFPGQRLLFEATAQAQLEIHTSEMATAIFADTIPCKKLQISDRFAPSA